MPTFWMAVVLTGIQVLLPAVAQVGAGPVSAAAQPDGGRPEVLNILAPGQGENLVGAVGSVPPSYTNQLGMYLALPHALGSLTDESLSKFYKSADLAPLKADEIGSVEYLHSGVRVERDAAYRVPRIYSSSRCGAMYGVGYARSEDRLWQMDLNRHIYRAARTQFLGPGLNDENLKLDAITFSRVDYGKPELRAMFRELATRYGPWGRTAQQDIKCYVDGINGFIAAARTDSRRLPAEYRAAHRFPEPWRITDEIAAAAFAHNISEGAGIGAVGNARVLSQLTSRFGGVVAHAIYRDLREADDPETPVVVDTPHASSASPGDARANAYPDLGSYHPRQVLLGRSPGPIDEVARIAFRGVHPSKSNALLIGGARTVSGHPIAVQGPQDGYGLPNAHDSEVQVEAPGLAFRGILEFFGPYPYDGARGTSFSYSATVQFNAQIDTFAERLCSPGPTATITGASGYRYRGKCRRFAQRDVRRAIAGTGDTYVLRSLRSVHGPVIGYATVEGAPVALALANATRLHEGEDFVRFAELFTASAVRGPRDFVRILSELPFSVGWYYVDEAHIAFVLSGRIPQRAAGVDPDLPVWGTGEWDWSGFNPDSYSYTAVAARHHPSVVDPPSSVIAGWNNQSAHGWPIASTMWALGPYHRVSLLGVPPASHDALLSVADVVRIHEIAALTDARAKWVYPLMREIIGNVKDDAELEAVLQDADSWVAAGALRLDSMRRGELDHSRAVILLERAWPRIIRAVFEPVLGRELLNEAGGVLNNLSSLAPPPSLLNGWLGYLSKDLRTTLGQPVKQPLSRSYCAAASRSGCRDSLLLSLREALREAKTEFGGDLSQWRLSPTCTRCWALDFQATGAAGGIPPAGYQSRPTYEMVSSFRWRGGL